MIQPEISVVIVSDYSGPEGESWMDFRDILTALARQDSKASVEWVVCANRERAAPMPLELSRILPGLKEVLCDATGSYELKNAGVRAATSDIVALLDADCTPASDWLGNALAAIKARPDVAAVSGRTAYPTSGRTERILALLSRSYLDRGKPEPTGYVANHNAIWRRNAYLADPLPEGLGPFAGRIQSERLLRAGRRLWFDPAIRVTHAFEGWSMEMDLRRNAGYGTVITRLHDPSMPMAWLTRIGVASIPAFVTGKILHSFRDCIRCAGAFGVRWWEFPLALLGSIGVHLLEIPGMWLAFRGKTLSGSHYR